MSSRERARRLLQLGKRPTTAPSDAQRIALTNAIAVITGLVVIIGLFVVRASDTQGILISVAALLLIVGVFVCQAAGRSTLAALLLCSVGLVAIAIQMVEGSLQSGGHLFLLVLVLLPFMILERRQSAAAIGISAAALLLFSIALVSGADQSAFLRLIREPAPLFLFYSAAASSMLVLLGYFGRRTTLVSEAQVALARHQSEALLRNIFPAVIARRLKRNDGRAADRLGDVSVLFCRILGLEQITSIEQLDHLGQLFAAFDDLCDQHGVEKIKSFGDCYMVAAGVPEPRTDHAEALAALALAMKAEAAALRVRSGLVLEVRMGINSGPVVAGVIGRRRYTYDLWGDTVNTAQRMEAHGQDGEIQVSALTFSKINHRYHCDEREVIDVKGKLPARAYLLRAPIRRATHAEKR